MVPLSYLDGVLTFNCTSKYKVGKSVKLKLVLVYGESVHTSTVHVTVISFEPNDDGTYACSGALDISASKLPSLLAEMAYAGVEGPDRRESRRLPCTVRILSKELASFRAVTTNVNLTGAELLCDDPVPDGHRLNLQFDLESVGVPDLKMQANCIWSLGEVDDASRKTRYRVGVAFVHPGPDAVAAWTKFYRRLVDNEGASVMLKTMDASSAPEKNPEIVEALTSPAPNQPTVPSADSSGGWSVPPTGNPFASGEMPAVPAQPGAPGGFSFPSPAAPSNPFAPSGPSGLNLTTAPAAVPPTSQMGGGFNSQAAPPPPLAPNKLSLPPVGGANPPQPPSKLNLPDAPAPSGGGLSLNLPSAQGGPGGGFQMPPTPAGGGGFSFPSSGTPTTPVPGFQLPTSQPPSGGGFGQGSGFQLPTPPSGGGGFQIPPAPGAGGFSMPGSPSPGGGGFSAPSAPGGFSMPSSQPPGGGFQIPSPPSAGASGGFSIPQAPGGFTPPPANPLGGGFSFPSTPAAGGGFQVPPAPGGGFQVPSPPSAGASGGFQIPSPPSAGASGGFQIPPASGGGFSMPTPAPAAPETVHPLGVNGASLAYRGRYDDTVRVGAHKMVQLSLNAGGQSMVVPINVSLTRVEPAPDGTCVVWCTVNEDAQKVAVLNQLLGQK